MVASTLSTPLGLPLSGHGVPIINPTTLASIVIDNNTTSISSMLLSNKEALDGSGILKPEEATNTTKGSGGGGGHFTEISVNATIIQPVFTFNWKVNNKNNSYFIVITMLSLAVVMAVLFTLFGLFMKAGAHAFIVDPHSDAMCERLPVGSGNSHADLLKTETWFIDE